MSRQTPRNKRAGFSAGRIACFSEWAEPASPDLVLLQVLKKEQSNAAPANTPPPAAPAASANKDSVKPSDKENKSSDQANGQPYHLSVNLQGVRDTLCLKLIVVSADDPTQKSELFDLNKDSTRSAFRRDDPTAAGTQFQTMIELPEGFKPGILKSDNVLAVLARVFDTQCDICLICSHHLAVQWHVSAALDLTTSQSSGLALQLPRQSIASP